MDRRLSIGATLSLAALMMVACAGKTVDIGVDARAVALTSDSIHVADHACGGAVFAHPNICCTGGSSTSAPTCEAWPQDPFHPCPDGWTTYPNAASCCSLVEPLDCATCDATAPGAAQPGRVDTEDKSDLCNLEDVYDGRDLGAVPPTSGGFEGGGPCAARCPPGYNGVSPYDAQGCCQVQADGTESCFGDTVTAMNGGTYDASANPNFLVVGGPPGAERDGGSSVGLSQPSCGGDVGEACTILPNWTVVDSDRAVCCATTSPLSSTLQCFALVLPLDIVVAPSSGSSGDTRFIDAGHM